MTIAAAAVFAGQLPSTEFLLSRPLGAVATLWFISSVIVAAAIWRGSARLEPPTTEVGRPAQRSRLDNADADHVLYDSTHPRSTPTKFDWATLLDRSESTDPER